MKSISSVIVLANSISMETLRDQVREVAQSDSRFNQATENSSASGVWVVDLIPSTQRGESWKAIIQAMDGKTYEVGFNPISTPVKLYADAKEVSRSVSYESIANDADVVVAVLGLDNALSLDNEGWALLAPFGEHRKERMAMVNGVPVHEKYIQVLDQAAVDAVIANDKGANVFQKIKRALIKRPIYRDHPDLKLYAPETVTMGNNQLIPLGVNDGLRRTERGLEFRPLLAPDGATAVENDGCKYPSALFLLKRTGVVRDGGWIEVRPFALASVGLTPTPNISGVDSLANAKTNTPAASGGSASKSTTTKDDNMKQLLIGWLAAQNVVLANDASDQAVFDAFNKEMSTRVASITALSNAKTELTGNITSLTAARDAEKKRADEAVTALGNAQTAEKAATKKFIEARVDLHITQGKIAVADRATEISTLVALDNSKLDAAFEALDKRAVKFPVGSQLSGERKTETVTVANAQEKILHLANHDEKYKKLDMTAAMKAIENDHPALFEQLRAKTSQTGSTATT